MVLFSCGGGSFIEYETIVRSLNESVCYQNHTAFFTPNKNKENPVKPSINNRFKQIVYGTDQVYSPKQFT